jgi:hypothetical protein
MNNAVRVCEGNRVANSLKLSQSISQRSSVGGVFIKTIATHILHRVENSAVRQRAGIVNRHDSRMLEPRDDLRLAKHSIAQIVRDFRRVEDLYRNQPIELSVFGQIDSSHAAASKLFDERVSRVNKAPQMVYLVI